MDDTALEQPIDLDALGEEATRRLQEFVRVDTINPPGNESRAVDFFARILEAEGIPYETAESVPGRGNIWARLDGGSKPGLLLLNHTDVVPADEKYWSVPPLSGEIRDGHIYGRGTLDMKSMGIFELEAFLALHRTGKRLNRDVVFMATADEEAGGFHGAGWLSEQKPDSFKGVGLLLNEGGGGHMRDEQCLFTVEVTQKVPLWIRLATTGSPGHGSTPPKASESAVTRLIRALSRIQEHRFTPRIIPAVDAYFKALAPHVDEPWRTSFQDMAPAVKDPAFMMELQQFSRLYPALTLNTCSITRLEGSSKINVIPPSASAELDCRLLPDQDPDEFLNDLRFIIDDPSITMERIMGFTAAVSTTDTELYRAIENVCSRHFPGAPVIPSVGTGFTDSHFFRDRGISCYGFLPAPISSEDWSGIHGNDERISVENVKLGTRLMLEIVQEVVY